VGLAEAASHGGPCFHLPRLTKEGCMLHVTLLSLAPHNIRYDELVGEGINPIILRRLYEEVGIGSC
jgi:hypothetical protein